MEKKTSFAYKIIRFLVWLFSPKMKVIGAEKLPDGPYIVAGNHSQMYGPIACELHFPGRHYIWCISKMMVLKEVPDYAFEDFWSKKPAYIRWLFRIASYLIAPLSVCVFNNAYTIPVYKDKRIFETMDLSVDALMEGAGVIVFPEEYKEHNNIVHNFQKGFVSVAKRYHAKTGKTVPFVPLYVCPKLKKLVIGDPVNYDPEGPAGKEQERICNILMDRISELAYELPYHKVVPYPNVPKKEYPDNKREDARS